MPRFLETAGFIISLPERTIRGLAASLGGLVYEATEVLLPAWLRRSRLYQSLITGTLRIAIELVGGVTGVLSPDSVTAQELAIQKAAGTGIEMAGLLAVGWSPLWLFAVTADLTGGTRTYLQALVIELKRDGLLSADSKFSSIEELLDNLEGTSGLMSNSLDTPPLNTDDVRRYLAGIETTPSTDLADADRMAHLYENLQDVAKQESSSLISVSSIIGAGALRAGARVGQIHVYDYYQDPLNIIATEGFPAYTKRVTRPYLAVARSHFDPQRVTYTERFVFRRQVPDVSFNE